jgi:hypothetical protein
MSDHHEFSPSTFERLAACPGSYNKSKNIDIKSNNQVRDEGELLHNIMATGDGKDNLDLKQLRMIDNADQFVEYLIKLYGKPNWIEREVKLELKDDETGEILTYGTADLILNYNDFGVIVDWKFGYIKVTAKYNWQLNIYTNALMQKYNYEKVIGYIFMGRHNDYTSHEFRPSLNLIKEVIGLAKKGDVLCRGEHCEYCPAFLAQTCEMHNNSLEKISTDLPLTMIPANELVEKFEQTKVISKMIKQIETELKRRIEEDGFCGSYQFVEKPGDRKVNDINGLYYELQNSIDLDIKSYMGVLDCSITKLQDLYIENYIKKYGGTKKNAMETFNSAIANFYSRETKKVLTKMDC